MKILGLSLPLPTIANGGMVWNFDAPTNYAFRVDPPEPKDVTPHYATIRVSWHDTDWRPGHISIDRERAKLFSPGDCYPFLTSAHRLESGILPLTLAPILLAASPYLLWRDMKWQVLERRRKMSRHGIALLDKIGDQLLPPMRDLLVKALHHDWERLVALDRKVSFAEAQASLARCTRTTRDWRFRQKRGLHHIWRDESGSIVGQMLMVDFRSDGIQVHGSWFEGEEAYELASCGQPLSFFL